MINLFQPWHAYSSSLSLSHPSSNGCNNLVLEDLNYSLRASLNLFQQSDLIRDSVQCDEVKIFMISAILKICFKFWREHKWNSCLISLPFLKNYRWLPLFIRMLHWNHIFLLDIENTFHKGLIRETIREEKKSCIYGVCWSYNFTIVIIWSSNSA